MNFEEAVKYLESEARTEEEALSEAIRKLGFSTRYWISVKERLPEEQTLVLLFIKYTNVFKDEKKIILCGYLNLKKKWIVFNFFDHFEVTHWMELPDQPT